MVMLLDVGADFQLLRITDCMRSMSPSYSPITGITNYSFKDYLSTVSVYMYDVIHLEKLAY